MTIQKNAAGTDSVGVNPMAADVDRSDQVRSEQILIAARGSTVNLLAGMVAAGLVAYGIGSGDEERVRTAAWTWFATLFVGLSAGIALARHLTKNPNDRELVLRRAPLLTGVAGFCGLVWGAIALAVPFGGHEARDSLVMVALAMVLMGGTLAQAVYRPMVITFGVCLVTPLIVGIASSHMAYYSIYSVAFALLCFAALASSLYHERQLRDQINYRLESIELQQAAYREKKSAEKAREQAEDAQQKSEVASRAKTAFLAAASHELRNPMHALGIYLGFLKRHNEDPQLAEWIELSGRAMKVQANHLNSLLDVSRISSGTIKPYLVSTPMHEILQEIDAEFRPLARDAELDWPKIKSPAVSVLTDHSLLVSILGNLVSNAIRYTPNGRIEVRCRVRGASLRCTVSDSGPGIPASELSKIFDPYYQVAAASRGSRKGLGIGLTIVRDLCAILGYSFRIRSRSRSMYGSGSIFSVMVPLAKTTDPVREEKPAQTEDCVKGKLILVIDNDRTDIAATTALLRSFHCRVLFATSSQKACEKLKLKEELPDLILADYGLNGETGLEVVDRVTRELAQVRGTEIDLPALIMSGDTSSEVLEEANDSGFEMLVKPVSAGRLWDALNRALTAKRSRSA